MTIWALSASTRGLGPLLTPLVIGILKFSVPLGIVLFIIHCCVYVIAAIGELFVDSRGRLARGLRHLQEGPLYSRFLVSLGILVCYMAYKAYVVFMVIARAVR
jgi:hypothetical protein